MADRACKDFAYLDLLIALCLKSSPDQMPQGREASFRPTEFLLAHFDVLILSRSMVYRAFARCQYQWRISIRVRAGVRAPPDTKLALSAQVRHHQD